MLQVYPCRCLCLGSVQITRTTPFRRIIRHLSQIFFTEGRTFIKEKLKRIQSLFVKKQKSNERLFARIRFSRISIRLSKSDAAAAEIIWSQLYYHWISWYKSNKVLLHLTTYIRTNNHIWKFFWKLNFKNGSREGFKDFALYFDFVILRHKMRKN